MDHQSTEHPLAGSENRPADCLPATDLTGIGLLLAAALLWSLNGAFIKAINDQGRGPDGITIAFYRSVFGGVVLLPFAWRGMQTLRFPTNRSADRRAVRMFPRPAALLGVVFFAAMTGCFVVANTMTEAGNAIVLQYTSTLWLFLLSPWLLGERPRTDDLWLLGIAMLGVAVVFLGRAGGNLTALIVALAAGLFYALLTLMIRRLRDSDPAAVTVFNNLGASVLLFVPVLLCGNLVPSTRSLVLLAVMGVVQFSIPYYLYARGLARVPAYQAGLITLAEPVLVPVWAFLSAGEVVPIPTVIGGALLIASIAALLLRGWWRSKPTTSTSR